MKHDKYNSAPLLSDESSPAPGRGLAEARAAKGIPAGYVQRQLGLTDSLFAALEGDDHRRLPGAVFVRGYLRRYAELVGVRPAPVLASYQRYLEQNGLAPSPPAGDPEGRSLVAMAGSAAALLLATSLVFGAILAEPQPGAEREIEAAAPFPAEQAVAPAASGDRHLQLDFVTDSWVEVVDAEDHILAVALQRAGTRLQLEGTPPFAVKLGYGPGVAITYLGEAVAVAANPETLAAELVLGK